MRWNTEGQCFLHALANIAFSAHHQQIYLDAVLGSVCLAKVTSGNCC